MSGLLPERAVLCQAMKTACSVHMDWAKLPDERKNTIIKLLERECFNKTVDYAIKEGVDRRFIDKQFREKYSLECSRVISNLDPKFCGSSYLIQKLILGEIKPEDVAHMPTHELCPEANKKLRDEIDLRQKQKIERKVCTSYVCRKCKGNQTVKIEYQARAADEASTLSVKCLLCEYVWRI